MLGIYASYAEFSAAAAEAAKRGELWFCPACFNFDVEMKTTIQWGLTANYVRCPSCCMRGPEVSVCSNTELKAADAWNRLPRPVVLSPALPTVTGWYFRQPATMPQERNIIYVTETMLESFKACGDSGRLWAGPIPAPVVPTEFSPRQ